MAEYIEREATVKAFCEQCSDYVNGKCTYEGACEVSIIATVPAADVQPICHGRWKYYKNNGITNTYICTNCQSKVETAIDVEPSKFKYCPNCNARMDGDTK